MITLRRATVADTAVMATIQGSVFDHAWPADEIAALVEAPPAVSIVASDETAIVGFILGRVVADEAEILSIAVARDRQRRGIAGQILRRWLREIRAAGADRAFLEVAADNAPALALYRACGFRTTGRRDGYYHRRDGTLGDALMMMAELPGA